MIAVANRIYVNPEYAERFEENFRNRAGAVDRMPGFVSNMVLRPTKPDEPYIVLTYWEGREQFDAWIGSDAFKTGHARSGTLPREAYSAPNQLEIHEIIMDTARDADPGARR